MNARAPEPARPNVEADRLCIRDGNALRLVPLHSITWVESQSNYVRLHTAEGSFLTRGTLAAFEELLDNYDFARVHRSFLVNLFAVRELRSVGGGDYVASLTDGEELSVSRTYSRDLIDRLQRTTVGPSRHSAPGS